MINHAFKNRVFCFPHIIGHRQCLMLAKKFNNLTRLGTLLFFPDILKASCVFLPVLVSSWFQYVKLIRNQVYSRKKGGERDRSNAHSLHTCHLSENKVSLRSPPQILYCLFIYKRVTLNISD